MPWSMRNEAICSTAGKILRPPEAPIANQGFPSRRAITGHMLVSGCLAGAREFGAPGRGSNHMTPLFIRMPVAGRTTLLPNTESSVCVSATMLPSRSIALRWVVLEAAAGEPAERPGHARPRGELRGERYRRAAVFAFYRRGDARPVLLEVLESEHAAHRTDVLRDGRGDFTF